MTKEESIGFKHLYKKTKLNYPTLVDITEEEINLIHEQAEKDKLQRKTDKYIIAIIGATLTIMISPFIIVKIYQLLNSFSQYLSLNKIILSDVYVDIWNFSLGFGSFATLIYLYSPPPMTSLGKYLTQKSSISKFKINKKQKNYIRFAIVATYLILGFILVLLLLNSIKTELVISVLKYYLFIPLSMGAFIMTMYLVLFALLLPFRKYIESVQHEISDRIKIAFILCNSINKLKSHELGIYLMEAEQSIKLLNRLYYASNLIKNYPYRLTQDRPSNSLLSDFEKSSNELDRIILDLGTLPTTQIASKKEQLLNYLNIVLSGNLLDLPKSEAIIINKTSIKKIKYYHYFLLAMYLTLPILIVIILNILLNITFSDYSHSLLKILYIIWAFVGIFSNPIFLNSENKDIIKDIIKSWLGK